ncbi:MAG: hypothetical protein J6W09_11240 [Bacteroidales bacterium]|nr:hypothetical protein [Bacteroidales bacterium]
MTTTNRILFTESEWMASTLSIARWTGGARINGHAYQLDRKYMVLIRSDYRRMLRPLGVDTLLKADKRYGTGRKSKNILLRLYHIIATYKRLQRENTDKL